MSELGALLEREMEAIRSPEFGVVDVGRRVERRQRNRRVRAAVVALAVAAIAGVGLVKAFTDIQRRVPAVPPPTGTIVLSRAVGPSITHLYTIGPDGVVRLLTPKPFDVFWISPDGSHVLYPNDNLRTSEILPAIVDLDGSHRRLVRSRVPMFPGGWSPDGTRIVGLGSRAGHSTGLYTARASDGGDQIQVTSAPGRRTDEAIGYSPEGSKILFLRSAKDVSAAFSRATKDLFVVDADGSGVLQLNPPGTVLGPFNAGVAGTPPQPVWDLRTASWSPDGTRVAFAAAIATPGEARNGEVERGLFVVDADGSDAHQIVPSAQILDAQWSPDGTWIAFTEANPDRPDVFIVHPDGTGLREVTSSSDGLSSWGPVWSPDSSALLFVRNPEQEQFLSQLWFVNVDGSDLTKLTNTPAYYFSYGWSPRSL
jgi:Tol biopolymer transport system component